MSVSKNPSKLKIFDHDGTLVFTPSPETLIQELPALEFYDQYLLENHLPKRKFTGYWGRKESILPPIFGKWEGNDLVFPSACLNKPLADLARQYQDDEDILNVLMTGRHAKMTHVYHDVKEHICKTILDSYQVFFDRYYYLASFQPTITFKINAIQTCLREFPSIRDVEIWEDRHAHTSEFWNFVKYYKKLGKIDSGIVHQVEEQDYNQMPENS